MLSTTYQPSLRAIVSPPAGSLETNNISISMDGNYELVLSDGSGAKEAHQVFADTLTLSPSGTQTLDLNAFGGALDPAGATYNLSKISAIKIRNVSTDASALVKIAGDGGGSAFTSVNGSTGAVPIHSGIDPNGGEWLYITPSANGLAVSSSNKNLKFTNLSSTAEAILEVIVIGA